MLNKLMLCLPLLVGCATTNVKETQFYYSLNLRPSITEVSTETGRIVSVHNPFPKVLTITLDCDEQINKRTVVIAANSETSFYVDAEKEVSMVCSIEHGWTLK